MSGVDREQVRRDALHIIDIDYEQPFAKSVLALLAELEQAERRQRQAEENAQREHHRAEQAERERDEARAQERAAKEWAQTMEHERDYEQDVVSRDLQMRLDAAEAQLAAVPALVEWIDKQARHHHRSYAHSQSFAKCEFPICQSGRDLVAEQAQGEKP